MKAIKNQTVYQCEFCNKRLLSKRGAKLHEEKYCWHPNSPHKQAIKKKQGDCPHEETVTIYRYIPGEAIQEPDYELCTSCNAHI